MATYDTLTQALPTAPAAAAAPAELPAGFVPVPRGTEPRDGNFAIIAGPDGREYMGPRRAIGLDPLPAPRVPPAKAGGAGEPLVDLGKIVRQGALPTIGGILGAVAGTAVNPGPGSLIGLSLGSMAGEGANQALGITEPSVMSVGVSGALPFVPAGLRAALTKLPGAEAGLNQLGQRIARAVPGKYGPTEDPSALYKTLERTGARIPAQGIEDAAARVAAKEALIPDEYRLKAVARLVKGAERLIHPAGAAGVPADVPIEQFLPTLQRLGAVYGAAARKGGPAFGEISDLYAGFQQSLEKAAAAGAGASVALLRRANEQFKRKLAEGELTDVLNKATKTVAGLDSFDADVARNLIRSGTKAAEKLERWLPEPDVSAIRAELSWLAKHTPAVNPIGKAGLSGTDVVTRAIGGAIGAGVGSATGLGPWVGGGLGAIGGIVAAEQLARALMSAPGRAFVRAVASLKLGGGGAAIDATANALLQPMFGAMRAKPDQNTAPAASRLPVVQ